MYIGKEPIVGNFQMCDAISVVNGQATYALQVGGAAVFPESSSHVLCSLNGILQKSGSSFSISSSNIIFSSNLATGDVIDFVMLLGSVLNLQAVSDNTISTAKIQDDAVTSAKLGTGDMTFPNGNLVFGTASKGVYLGVTSATAANLLNDYEFGTFTPSVAPTSGSFTTVGTVSGYYTKIGNLVHYQIEISISNNGSGSANIDVTNLPFTSASTGLVHTVNHGRETQVNGSTFVTIQSVNTTALVMLSPPFGNGAGYSLNGTYRV